MISLYYSWHYSLIDIEKVTMNIQELLHLWEKTGHGELTREAYSVRLPVESAAKLHALAEMYPRRQIPDLITDLLATELFIANPKTSEQFYGAAA
jgi:hypothetical protein